MKKSIFFAALIAAITLTFVACDPKDNNTPETPSNTDTITQPTTVNPSDYIGTNWRVDSCLWQGELTSGPHPFIKVIAEDMVLWWGQDSLPIKVEDGKITFNEPNTDDLEGDPVSVTLTIVKADKDFVHLKSITGMEFFMARIPDPYGTPVEVTEANILGTWKWEYNYDSDIHDGVEDYRSYFTNPGVTFYTFTSDGIMSGYNNVTSSQGEQLDDMKWAVQNGKLRYCMPEYWDDPESQEWYDVQFLSNESMVLYIMHDWGEVITTSTEYYTRVK